MKKLIVTLMIALIYYKRNGKDNYVSLKQLVNIFNQKINFEDIFNIAKYLEAQGYIKANYVLGDVLVNITTLGQLTYEDIYEHEGRTIIDKLTDEEVINNLNAIAEEITTDAILKSKNDIIALIDEIKNDINLSQENGNRKTYLNKLEIIKLEIDDEPINTDSIANAIDVLLKCTVVPHKIRDLAIMLNIGII